MMRHVKFVEREPELGRGGNAPERMTWEFSSDVCKHCARAGCLESCPTGAIVRTEYGSVYVQPDVCNGCGYCVSACPFGVIDKREDDGRAWKCTLCYDRLKADMTPACAKSCPTASIQFGDLVQLRVHARKRVDELHRRGTGEAYLYGVDQPGTEGLNAFFLLVDKPEAYNLPPDPVVPTKKVKRSWMSLAGAAVAMAALAVAAVTGA